MAMCHGLPPSVFTHVKDLSPPSSAQVAMRIANRPTSAALFIELIVRGPVGWISYPKHRIMRFRLAVIP